MRHERTIKRTISFSLRALLGVILVLVTGILLTVAPGILGSTAPAWAQAETTAALPPVKELAVKVDVNNTVLRNYRQLPGFYPTLARILVIHSPYNSLEDMLAIPDLTEQQKALIEANAMNFEFGDYEAGRYQLEQRINQGLYG